MATILVVDDDKNIRNLYSAEFTDEGYNVLTAEDANEAMRIIGKEKVDLVILDLKMPGIHGIEALEQMMIHKRDLTVLINTAFSEYRDNFLTWLAEDYIIKSSDLSVLKEKVRNVLQRKGVL